MPNAVLMQLSHSERARRCALALPATRRVVDRFIAGDTEDEALRVAHGLIAGGRRVTIDRLGEDVTDRAGARQVTEAYLALIDDLAARELASEADVSLKLSALGHALPLDGAAIALDNARRICAAGEAVGVTVSVDMEDHSTVEDTLAAVVRLRRDFPSVAAVVQAALRRTEGDLAALRGPGSRVRLVKGAYAEPASVAYTARREVDAAYRRCLALLMAGHGFPQVATHDPELHAAARQFAVDQGRAADSFEFQLLYGVNETAQQQLRAEGYSVRIYLPYGSDWYGYFTRRLAERPANLLFFLRALGRR